MHIPTLICYCFQYSEEDITKDVREHSGKSAILERILAEKRAGGCRCHIKNPTGR